MRFLLLFTAVTALAQQQPPTRILIAYHSVTGNTEKMAQSIQEGAASVAGVEVTLRKIEDVTDDDIVNAVGIVVGTPVHWFNISGEAKLFLDRVGSVLFLGDTTHPDDFRTGGAFCTGGGAASGKDLARQSILSAFLGMGFIPVGGFGPEATTGNGVNGNTITKQSLATAETYGKTFARLTRQIRLAAAAAPGDGGSPAPRRAQKRP